MTSDLTPRNRALVALKVLSVGLALATAPGPANAEATANPAEATVFLRFACIEKVKDAPPDVDKALFTPEKRVSWGSGVFVRHDGLLVTTDHSLADLAKDEPADVAGKTVTVGCDREDIAVDVFEVRNITRALQQGQAGDYSELATGRDASLADSDVMFLKADSRGYDVPWLCAPEAIALRDFDGMPITAAGVDNDLGQPEYVERKGLATNDPGPSLAYKYLKMEPAAVAGMSGGPVVRSDGALVGIVHGNRISSHPLATESYFVPLTLFDGHLRQYVDPCAPKIHSSFEEVIVLLEPSGENYNPEISDPKFRLVIDGTRNLLRTVLEGTVNVVVGNRSFLKAALPDDDRYIDRLASGDASGLLQSDVKRLVLFVTMIDYDTTVELNTLVFSADKAKPLESDGWPLVNVRPELTLEEHKEQFGQHLIREFEREKFFTFEPDPIYIDCILPGDERRVSPDVEKKLHMLSGRLADVMGRDKEWGDYNWQSPGRGLCSDASGEGRRDRLDRLTPVTMPRYFLDPKVTASSNELTIAVYGGFRWRDAKWIAARKLATALEISEYEDCLSNPDVTTMECSLKKFLAEKLSSYRDFAPGDP